MSFIIFVVTGSATGYLAWLVTGDVWSPVWTTAGMLLAELFFQVRRRRQR